MDHMSTRKTKAQLEAELTEAQQQIAGLQRALQDTKNIGGDRTQDSRTGEAENNLQSEEKLRQLLDLLPVGISILNEERKVVFQNTTLAKILDIGADELQRGNYQNRKYLDAYGSPMPVDGFASVQAQKSGHAVYNVETGIVKENGESIWTSVSAVPVDFPDWKTVIVTADVTARKQSENNLEVQHQRLKVLRKMELEILKAESADHIIKAALDHLRDLIDCDRSNLTFIDWGTNESVIYEVNTAGETAVPKGRRYPLEPYQDIIKVLSSNQILSMADLGAMLDPRPAVKDLLKDGLRSLLSVPLISQDKLIGMLTVHSTRPYFFDEEKVNLVQEVAHHVAIAISQTQLLQQVQDELTLRIQAEQTHSRLTERLSLATNSAHMGIWDWDIQKNELFWDDQMYALYGLRPGEFAGAYEAWLNGVHPDDRDSSNEVSAAAVRGEREYDTEFRVLWPNGSVHWLKAKGQVFCNEEGTPLRMVGINYDITERKQAEEKLAESEERFSIAFHASPVSQSITTLGDNVVMAVNDACCRLFDYGREELIGATASKLNLLENPADKEAATQEILATGHFAAKEVVIRTRSGEIRNALASIEPILWKGVPAVLSSMIDITERKRAEQAAQENHAKLNAALESMTDAVFISDIQGNFVDFNEAFATFHKFRNKEECAKTFAEYPDILDVFMSTGELAPVEMWAVPRALRGEIGTNVEYSLCRKDSGETWVGSYSFAPIRNTEGAIVGSVVVGRDITERKRADELLRLNEERLRLSLQAANQGLYDLNVQTGDAIVNEEYALMLGYDPTDFHETNSFWIERLHPDDRERTAMAYQDYINGKLPAYEVEFRQRTRSGEWKWILSLGKILKLDEQGNPLRMLGTHTDITARKQMEEDLRRSISELEQFAYVASHDLQEPLRAVAGMVELLSQRYKGKLDERADTYITHAVEASQRMQKLINDLLEYSRITRFGKSLEPTNLESVLQAALKNLYVAIEESHAQITYDPLPTVMADPSQLTQVLQNLIGNAIKFRSEHTPQIHVSAEKTGNAWQISVRDNGIGIDPQYFERIFLLFQRLHTRRTYSGTGIGLSLCKKIIERHGGTINVDSTPNKGSTFHFTLPEMRHDAKTTSAS
jgi:PAS domain S-box-containing protein